MKPGLAMLEPCFGECPSQDLVTAAITSGTQASNSLLGARAKNDKTSVPAEACPPPPPRWSIGPTVTSQYRPLWRGGTLGRNTGRAVKRRGLAHSHLGLSTS